MSDTIEETKEAEAGFDADELFAETAGEAVAADASDKPEAEAKPAAGADAQEPAATDTPAEELPAAEDAAQAPAEEDEEDPWAAALAEQEEAEAAQPEEPPPAQPAAVRGGSEQAFPPLSAVPGNGSSRELDIVMNIPVNLNVELGRTKISIRQLLELAQGSVIELDGLAGDPMDILINGYLIAQGEVVVVEDRYGIRITDIVTPSERVQKLNR